MKAKFCTTDDLYKALEIVNQKYEGNITFNRSPEPRGKHLIFTLRVKDSKQVGHGRGFSFGDRPAKRLTSACWHVHGDFFDALIKEVNQDAVIVIGDKQIYKQSYNTFVTGNWEDYQRGSNWNPVYASELCDCE